MNVDVWMAAGSVVIESRMVEWFRGGLISKAHRLLRHSTLGLRVIKRERNRVVPRLDMLRQPEGWIESHLLTIHWSEST